MTGCAKPETVLVPQAVRISPPAVLMQDTPEPVLSGDTNGDLEDLARDALLRVRACNQDKARLREWAAGGEQ